MIRQGDRPPGGHCGCGGSGGCCHCGFKLWNEGDVDAMYRVDMLMMMLLMMITICCCAGC